MSHPFGPTDDFPSGKLGPSDEGGLKLGLANAKGKVIVNFGTPVAWIGFDPQGAADFAAAVLKHAREAAVDAGVVIEFMVQV